MKKSEGYFLVSFSYSKLKHKFSFCFDKNAAILLSNGCFKSQFLNGKWKEIAFIVLDTLSLTNPNRNLSCNHFT